MKHRKLRLSIIVLLHLLGFPLMLLGIILNAKLIIENGKSYGLYAYAGIVLTVVFIIIYYVSFTVMVLKKKKSPVRQGITLSVLAFFMFAGLFIFISKVAPDKLRTVTSGTISYEDLTGEYNKRADINKTLLDDFIYINSYGNDNFVNVDTILYSNQEKDEHPEYRNYVKYIYKDKAGKEKILNLATNMEHLKNDNPNKYIKEKNKWLVAETIAYKKYSNLAMRSELVKKLRKDIFDSLVNDGYNSFSGPWMNFAADNIITTPSLIHLLLDYRNLKNSPLPSITPEGLRLGSVKWGIIDMMGPPLGISKFEFKDTINALADYGMISKEEAKKRLKEATYNNIFEVPSMSIPLEILKDEGLSSFLNQTQEFKDKLISFIQRLIKDPNVVGSPINIALDTKEGKLNLQGSSITRGSLGYQNSAWLNSNDMIYMLCSVFSIRVISLLFCGYIILMSLLTGILREKRIKVERLNIDDMFKEEIKNGFEKERTFKTSKKSRLKGLQYLS